MEKWEDGCYITAIAGSSGGSSLVVMSKGTPYTQQSYKVLPPGPEVAALLVELTAPGFAPHSITP